MGVPLTDDLECTVHRLEQLQSIAPFTSPLFRVNYYAVVLIKSGDGFAIIDKNRFPICTGSLFFTNPGHIKGYGTTRPTTGFIIAFSEEFLKHHADERTLDECSYLYAEVAEPRSLNLSEIADFDDIITRMLTEYKGNSRYREAILGNLLMVLLLKIRERFWGDYDPRLEADGTTEIVRAFQQNLEAHFRSLAAGTVSELYQVQDFAAEQLLHPNYFSTVIKQKTGKMVKTWIAEKAISEAKAYLARSQYPIQHIADQLGFGDAAHFSRFFKNQTGTSPSEFRRQSHPSRLS